MNTTKDKKWIAGVYIRVSTDHEEQKTSLGSQESFFVDWCERQNVEIYDNYVDEGLTGTTMKNRIAFHRLLKDAYSGKINCIVSKSITRFARNQVDTLKTIRELKEQGIRCVFVQENLDTANENGLIGLFAWLAEQESVNLSERRKMGGRERQKKGYFTGSRPPFGYKSINKKLVINEEEAKTIRKIFDLYLEGHGIQSIARIINADGIKTRRGYNFAKTKIQYIIENPAYKGWLIGNRYTTVDPISKKRIENPKDKWVIVKDSHTPIIDEETFNKAQKILKDRKFSVTKRTKHLFTGIIKCKSCGSNMMYKYSTKKLKDGLRKYEYYSCNTKRNKSPDLCNTPNVKLDLIKEVVQNQLAFIKVNKEYLTKLKKQSLIELRKKLSQSKTLETDVEDKIKQLNKKREVLLDKYLEGNIPDDLYKQKENDFTLKLKELNKRKEQVKSVQDMDKVFDLSFRQFEKALEDFTDIEKMTNVEMKKLIDAIYVLEDGSLEILMKYHIPSSIEELANKAISCHYDPIVTTVGSNLQLYNLYNNNVEVPRNEVNNYDKMLIDYILNYENDEPTLMIKSHVIL